jgi:hypothetical protein
MTLTCPLQIHVHASLCAPKSMHVKTNHWLKGKLVRCRMKDGIARVAMIRDVDGGANQVHAALENFHRLGGAQSEWVPMRNIVAIAAPRPLNDK